MLRAGSVEQRIEKQAKKFRLSFDDLNFYIVLFFFLFHLAGAAFDYAITFQDGGDGAEEAFDVHGKSFPAAFQQNLGVVAV